MKHGKFVAFSLASSLHANLKWSEKSARKKIFFLSNFVEFRSRCGMKKTSEFNLKAITKQSLAQKSLQISMEGIRKHCDEEDMCSFAKHFSVNLLRI
jgi:hypothetical protein